MSRWRRFFEWVLAHKAEIGATFLFVSNGMSNGSQLGVMQLTHREVLLAFWLSQAGWALVGGGMLKSDSYHKDRIAAANATAAEPPIGGTL